MTVSGQRTKGADKLTKSIDDILSDIDPRISIIARNFLAEQTTMNPNVQFMRGKRDIVKEGKKGYAITGTLLERTNGGPKPLLSGRIDIYSPTDYDISIEHIEPSYASQAQALRDKLKKDELQNELYK